MKTLPPSPHLDPLRREARQLQRAFTSGEAEARERVARCLPRRAAAGPLTLADAQCVVAREYGFPSWPRLKLHVEAGGDPLRSAVLAVRLGDPGRLAELLAAHRHLVHHVDEENQSLLHHICSGSRRGPDRLALLRILLGAGADPNVAIPDGSTPLHFAAQMGQPATATFLLDHGADPARRDSHAGTPLHHALWSGNPRVAELLVTRGAPVDDNLRTAAALGRANLIERHLLPEGGLAPTAGQQREWAGFYWRNPPVPSERPQDILAEALDLAMLNDRMPAARRLVSAGARFDARAAHTAVTSGRTEKVDLWLSTDPELGQVLDWGWPAWTWAHFSGHEELGLRLKRLAAARHLPSAADLGRLDLVEALLAAGADPNQTNHEGTSALGLALGARSLMASPEDGGSPEVAARLVAAGARVDLASAAKLGRLQDVERHLAAGADPAAALGPAVEARQLAVVARLVAAGATVDLFDAARLGQTAEVLARLPADWDWQTEKNGWTVLDRAISSGSVELVAALLARGAPVCGPGYDEFHGRAAVHVAGWSGAEAAIWDLLLEHGADINHSSDPGTPFDCARMARHPETMAFIHARGGRPTAELVEQEEQSGETS